MLRMASTDENYVFVYFIQRYKINYMIDLYGCWQVKLFLFAKITTNLVNENTDLTSPSPSQVYFHDSALITMIILPNYYIQNKL